MKRTDLIDEKKACLDYLNGVAIEVISNKYNIAEGTLYKILKRNDVKSKKEYDRLERKKNG